MLEIKEIDRVNKTITITNGKQDKTFKDGDSIKKKFLPNTIEKYECIVKFIKIQERDFETGKKKEEKLEPMIQRTDVESWIMGFNLNEYEIF